MALTTVFLSFLLLMFGFVVHGMHAVEGTGFFSAFFPSFSFSSLFFVSVSF